MTEVRRHRALALTAGAVVAVLAVTGGVAALTSGADTDLVLDPADRQELAAAGGEPCPAVLPQADGSDGFGTDDPPPGAPDLPVADRGWVCHYSATTGEAGADANGSYVTWRREGGPVALDPAQLDLLRPTLQPFELQEGEGCTDDLGPRWLLVTSAGGNLTGVAVDDFGCRNVRLTDHPAEVEPGEASQPGTVPGVLEAPAAFVDALRSAFSAGPTAGSSQRLQVEMGHCWVEPITFDGEQWNVPFDEQFGWGGLEPRNWQGTGAMTRVAEDEARFDDDGGASVRFLLVDDPAVTPVDEAICM